MTGAQALLSFFLQPVRLLRVSWPKKRVRRKDNGSGWLFPLGDGQRGWKAV